VTTLTAIILALYGWWLINRLAKSREAYDLHHSVIALLEQLVADGTAAWESNPAKLDDHTELKLTSKVAAVEQRIDLIKKHYTARLGTAQEVTSNIVELRRNLTISKDQMREGEVREAAILRLSSVISSSLLENNYSYIVAGRKLSIRIGIVLLISLVALLLFSQVSTDWLSAWEHFRKAGTAHPQ